MTLPLTTFGFLKQTDSMSPRVLIETDHRRRQDGLRTSVIHFCSYHIWAVAVIYYLTDARQHGIFF